MSEKKKPNRTKSKQIAFRVTEQEYDELMKLVALSGMTQQQFFTTAIRNTKITNTDGLKEFRTELKRIGTNLNQIARSCNEGNQATRAEVEQIGKELNEVWQQLRRFTAEQV